MDGIINHSGILYFKSSGTLTSQEIDELDKFDVEISGKTKSQRLRNVLYRVFEGCEESDFNTFYSIEMEKIIEHYKLKIK